MRLVKKTQFLSRLILNTMIVSILEELVYLLHMTILSNSGTLLTFIVAPAVIIPALLMVAGWYLNQNPKWQLSHRATLAAAVFGVVCAFFFYLIIPESDPSTIIGKEAVNMLLSLIVLGIILIGWIAEKIVSGITRKR